MSMSLLYHPLPISAYACSRFPSLGAALYHAGFLAVIWPGQGRWRCGKLLCSGGQTFDSGHSSGHRLINHIYSETVRQQALILKLITWHGPRLRPRLAFLLICAGTNWRTGSTQHTTKLIKHDPIIPRPKLGIESRNFRSFVRIRSLPSKEFAWRVVLLY